MHIIKLDENISISSNGRTIYSTDNPRFEFAMQYSSDEESNNLKQIFFPKPLTSEDQKTAAEEKDEVNFKIKCGLFTTTIKVVDKNHMLTFTISLPYAQTAILGLFNLLHINSFKLSPQDIIKVFSRAGLYTLDSIINMIDLSFYDCTFNQDFFENFIKTLIDNKDDFRDDSYKHLIERLVGQETEDSYEFAKKLFADIKADDIKDKLRDKLYFHSGSFYLNLANSDRKADNYDKYLQTCLADLMNADGTRSKELLNKILSQIGGWEFGDSPIDLAVFQDPESIPSLLALLKVISDLKKEVNESKKANLVTITEITKVTINSSKDNNLQSLQSHTEPLIFGQELSFVNDQNLATMTITAEQAHQQPGI